jgi:tRNA (guanine-N7-)-methyltransferase
MTKLFIHSTDPEMAARMKPEVLEKIILRRKILRQHLTDFLSKADRITLEIGCGHGHFLTAYGQSFETEKCVGIDVNKGRIYKALKKRDRADLKNVHFLEADSMEFMTMLPHSVRIEKTWILFPDPWPKKRHFKNRIIQDTFLKQLAKRTVPRGRLYLRSDYKEYIDWSMELIDASQDWKCVETYDWPELTTTVFQELTNNRHHSLVAELQPAEK